MKKYRVDITIVNIVYVSANNLKEAKRKGLSKRADDAYTKSIKARLLK